MIPVHAMERITRLIQIENINQMKKWSDRYGAGKPLHIKTEYLRKLMKQIKSLLIIISGNDVVAMLKGYNYDLDENENKISN